MFIDLSCMWIERTVLCIVHTDRNDCQKLLHYLSSLHTNLAACIVAFRESWLNCSHRNDSAFALLLVVCKHTDSIRSVCTSLMMCMYEKSLSCVIYSGGCFRSGVIDVAWPRPSST